MLPHVLIVVHRFFAQTLAYPPELLQDIFDQGITNYPNVDSSNNLLHGQIDIRSEINWGSTFLNVLVHEIGHTLGLADCNNCAFPSIMSKFGGPNISNEFYAKQYYKCKANPTTLECANQAIGFPQGLPGPTLGDLGSVATRCPNLALCNQTPPSQPPVACSDGSTPSVGFGFASNGTPGDPVTTCDGTPCDGCNSQCSSFLGTNCDTSSGGGSTTTCNGIQCSNGACLSNPPLYCTNGPQEYCCTGASGEIQQGDGGCCPFIGVSPIIIDVANQGFHLTGLSNGVTFSRGPNTRPVTLTWTDPLFKNAWLVLDRNGNGRIDDLTELFGDLTPQPKSSQPNGYIALSVFDDPRNGGNSNGIIDQGDAVYWRLRL
jgi:hypothetical protein